MTKDLRYGEGVAAGDLDQRIIILSLGQTATGWEWKETNRVWAKAERLERTNLFSSVGIGVTSVKFTMRTRELTLFNAIRWNGGFCFITAVNPLNRFVMEVSGARIEPKICTVKKDIIELSDLKRRAITGETTVTFPACMVEKYMGRVRESPMNTTEITNVLVTPKVIEILPGDVVMVEGKAYTAVVCHTTDEYKNEYEVTRKEDD